MKDKDIRIRVNEKLKEKIIKKSESEGKSLSEYVLDLVKLDINKKEE